MKDFLVVANLKTGMLTHDLGTYLTIINKCSEPNLVICPTSIYAPYFLKHAYKVGLQDVFYDSSESCTGEVTPKQAISMGITYVMIGHRQNTSEMESNANKKIVESLKQGLTVILCVGETLEEKNMLKTSVVIKKQLTHALRNISSFDNILIAYEPIWAIETGKIPSNQDITSVTSYIKQIVYELYNYDDVKVIYGGSIDENNVELIKKVSNICGVLVGKSALDANKLLKIVEKCK